MKIAIPFAEFCEDFKKIMRAVAVICEYNPFHRGHKLLLDEIHKRFPEHTVISVMSGNTVQRGDFAIFDKYFRARTACDFGSDLVFELPFPFSSSAGEQFASAGTYIASALGAEYLAFGSESGNDRMLVRHACRIASTEFASALRNRALTSPDKPYIGERSTLYKEMYGESLPDTGNDILAIEYLSKILSGGYAIQPAVIHRTENFTATEARLSIAKNDRDGIFRLLPNASEVLSENRNGGLYALSQFILGSLRAYPSRDTGNGIRNALKSCAIKATDINEFLSLLPTKNYTLARLRRELIAYLTDVSEKEKNVRPEYTVLLAATGKGLEYLSENRKNLSIPILTKPADLKKFSPEAEKQYQKSELCQRIYTLGFEKNQNTPYISRPYVKK